MAADLCVSPLSSDFNRAGFHCDVPELNDFLRKRAWKHMAQGMSVTYVLHRKDEREILGYYAIAMAEIRTIDLPDALIKGLPRHPVPAVRIGRLAVARAHREKGYGALLLWDAIERSVRLATHIGARAIEAHAKNAVAREFYIKYGFVSLVDDVQHLYLAMDTARAVLSRLP